MDLEMTPIQASKLVTSGLKIFTVVNKEKDAHPEGNRDVGELAPWGAWLFLLTEQEVTVNQSLNLETS